MRAAESYYTVPCLSDSFASRWGGGRGAACALHSVPSARGPPRSQLEPGTIWGRGASVVEDPGDCAKDNEREEDAQPPEDIGAHPRHPPCGTVTARREQTLDHQTKGGESDGYGQAQWAVISTNCHQTSKRCRKASRAASSSGMGLENSCGQP
jgi:hypothetical protein